MKKTKTKRVTVTFTRSSQGRDYYSQKDMLLCSYYMKWLFNCVDDKVKLTATTHKRAGAVKCKLLGDGRILAHDFNGLHLMGVALYTEQFISSKFGRRWFYVTAKAA